MIFYRYRYCFLINKSEEGFYPSAVPVYKRIMTGFAIKQMATNFLKVI